MSLTTVRVLDLVERKLRNPERWIKDHEAVDNDGVECDPDAKHAQKFCLLGAFNAIDVGEKFKKFAAGFIINAVNKNLVGFGKPLSSKIELTEESYDSFKGEYVDVKISPLAQLPEFNDAQKVTHDDVIRALKLAKQDAKEARKRRKTRSRRKTTTTKQ